MGRKTGAALWGSSGNGGRPLLERIFRLRGVLRWERQGDRDFRAHAVRVNIDSAVEMANALSHPRDPYPRTLRANSIQLFCLYSLALILNFQRNPVGTAR